MQKLQLDDGIEEYEINGRAILRFNSSDANLYDRFYGAVEEITALEKQLEATAKDGDPRANLDAMAQADRGVKQLLTRIFEGNDFDAIFGGVNLMAVGANGERIITNFFSLLSPIMESGAKRCADGKADAAVAQAKANRAARRAAAKKA